MSQASEPDQPTSHKTQATRSAEVLAADLSMSGHALQAGTRIKDYVITGLLGEGGFGIVYLAEETALQREVAIKEYLPSSMASRAKDAQTVLVKSRNHEETFHAGLKSFINEARLLARFDHPALVKVHRFWEAHGTAYMVMPYYRGPTLKSTLAEMGHLPSQAELQTWLWPLMDALTVMHAAQCYHRDIAPDNILITDSGPLLLDFGAARRVIGDMTHALTVVLKPGFAPIEQYGEMPDMTQGPWTDVYALASVLYAAISGRKPLASVERLLDDRLRPLAEIAAGRYPAPFLEAIDAAMALKPADRPQSIADFRALLLRPDPAAAQVSAAPAVVRTPSPPRPTPKAAAGSRATWPLALGAVGLLVLAAGAYLLLGAKPAAAPQVQPELAQRVTAPPPEPAVVVVPASAPVPVPVPAAEPASSTQPVAAPPPEPVPIPVTAQKPAAEETPKAAPKPVVKPPASPPASVKTADVRAKCSDILQKASLEPLSSSEQAFLRKECR
jgi:serine/threonine protein kinase